MTLFVNCPTCQAKVAWSQSNEFRPFCSNRCKKIDLGAWAEEKYVVTTPAPSDDLPPDEPPTKD